ncbi:ImmA/IrrE family metallo-endopeptidase [Corynebacterium pseudodiphtheriticum]|uniref:ImmA/IrrE family metallo-endopeptidase n=1 Tax=Corynebacterium pseudodiphtheriticum TaxID=37637 RepID=UPI00254156D6|nr:ImmA/IrrE family metallo-endopeptidase [Corynebacterium pseudodiphtheriticum]MDK4286585.1 ImmA/IrrE family metallo-endopeptidase [Corynebacterium pseudodiphtheriticum]MDK4315902.1 ImmA/IrrE family metallo-endopeptidase [Corynebacterium pseudodiphtheriticum]
MSNEAIGRAAAERFRKEHSLGSEPITNLVRLIERKVGIGVAYVRSSAAGHGMMMLLDDMHLMAVGCTKHPMRLRSTLAHELGHYQLGTIDSLTDGTDWARRSPEEIQADAFARHLLVPMGGVADMVKGEEVTLATLSDIVQTYLASPHMVAIQMRDAGAINADTCKQWGQITAGALAAQFGWRPEYQALVEQSSKPRGPQSLMTRAIEGYRQGGVASSTIAKLSGDSSASATKAALAEEGITPVEALAVSAPRPKDTGERLTSEELSALMGGAE